MHIVLPTLILSVMGVVFGALLAYAAKAFEIKSDPRIALVKEQLPGVNCGVCGHSGCEDYAAAVVGGEPANLCTVGGQAVAKKIGEILGVEAGNVRAMAAHVKCAGDRKATGIKFDYRGIDTCAAANLVQQGPAKCGYGCLGFGDCINACKFDAIYMKDGVAEILASKCTACVMCAAACPKKLIELTPASDSMIVRCLNVDRGAITSKACSAGCIGCALCVKACAANAISIVNNLAVINPELCSKCGACIEACPRKCIEHCECAIKRAEAG